MNKSSIIISIFFAFFLCFSAQAEMIRLHGSTTVTANLFDLHKSKIETKSGTTLNIKANGSSRGIKDLLSGEADMGMISSSMESMRKKMTDPDASRLVGHQVGVGELVFVTHPSNKITSLTFDQLTKIFNGEITKWSELGGGKRPIMIVSEYTGGGMRTTLEKKLLSGNRIKAKTKDVPNGRLVKKMVAQIPHALGFMTNALLDESITKLKTDKEIKQPLILVTKGNPTPSEQKLIDTAKHFGIQK